MRILLSKRIGRLPKAAVVALGVAGIVALAVLDYWTGTELSFFAFYFAPISLMAWHGGRWGGLAGAGISALAWSGSNIFAGLAYTLPFALYWNSAVRFAAFVLLASVISRMRVLKDEHETNALTDSLTGCVNSRGFYAALEDEMRRSRRYGRGFSVLYLDLDDFKQVNDHLGHKAGDQLLGDVAAHLRQQVRATDTLARLGGDEFALLARETSEDAARVLASKLHGDLLEFVHRHSMERAGVSAGLVHFHAPPATADDVVHAADSVMYEAKRRGKGALVIAIEPRAAEAETASERAATTI
jgi:diguanylate cyclase (GGDEF)-like protein